MARPSPVNIGGIILQKAEKKHLNGGICAIPHDILPAEMEKVLLRVLVPLLILASILAFALALSPSASGQARSSEGAAPNATIRSGPSHRASGSTPTPTPAEQDKSRPGSTDGLVVMSFAIVLIIIIPVLIQRALWRT
jgi:hypothetical protein